MRLRTPGANRRYRVLVRRRCCISEQTTGFLIVLNNLVTVSESKRVRERHMRRAHVTYCNAGPSGAILAPELVVRFRYHKERNGLQAARGSLVRLRRTGTGPH